MRAVFAEVHRVLRNDGTLWINVGDSYVGGNQGGTYNPETWKPLDGSGGNATWTTRQQRTSVNTALASRLKPKSLLGLPWRLALALQADGWILRSEIIWHKVNPMPESVQDRVVRAHEHIFMFSKAPRYYFDMEAIREPSTFDPRDRLWDCARHGQSFVDHAYDAEHGRQGTKTQAEGWVRMSHPNGRASRSVWALASEPTPYAHFATFPTELVRKCLRAGVPQQVCRDCAAPWVRTVAQARVPCHGAIDTVQRYKPVDAFDYGSAKTGRWAVQTTTTGFAPTCHCGAPGDGKAVCFDPFCGSGTTLLVARELGHHGVGLDLSAPYLHAIARQRLGLAALAAWSGQPTECPRLAYDDLPLFAGGR
jgi:DNA modification methylase